MRWDKFFVALCALASAATAHAVCRPAAPGVAGPPTLVVQSGHGGLMFAAAFTRDGCYLVTATRQEDILVWSPQDGSLLGRVPFQPLEDKFHTDSPILVDHIAALGGSHVRMFISAVDTEGSGERATTKTFDMDVATRKWAQVGRTTVKFRPTLGNLPSLLATSADGLLRLYQDGLKIAGQNRKVTPLANTINGPNAVALSPGAAMLATAHRSGIDSESIMISAVDVIDLRTNLRAPTVKIGLNDIQLQWLDADHYLASGNEKPPVVVDAPRGVTAALIWMCGIAADGGDGALVAIGRPSGQDGDFHRCNAPLKAGLWRFERDDPQGQGFTLARHWRRVPIQLLENIAVTSIVRSPDGRLAITFRPRPSTDREQRILDLFRTSVLLTGGGQPDRVIRLASERRLIDPARRYPPQDGADLWTGFSNDGARLLVKAFDRLFVWDIASGKVVRMISASIWEPSIAVDDGETVSWGGAGDVSIRRVRLADRAELPPVQLNRAFAGGQLEGGLAWATGQEGRTMIWHVCDARPILEIIVLAGGNFVAKSPEGRYDTDISPDTNLVRWVMPDAPWQSLAPQSFMRQLYEPLLVSRLMACQLAPPAAPPSTPIAFTIPHIFLTDLNPHIPGRP